MILGLWPLLQLLAIRWGRDVTFLHGSDPVFYALFAFVLVTSVLLLGLGLVLLASAGRLLLRIALVPPICAFLYVGLSPELDLPDPETFQLNRFFTEEFFALIERRLNPNGVLCFSLAYYPDYLTDLMRRKLSSVFNTARLHFSEVLVIPGKRAFFLCRNGPLSTDIPALLRTKSVLLACQDVRSF